MSRPEPKPKPCPCCGSRKVFNVVRGSGWGASAVGCSDCGLEVEGGAPCAGKRQGESALQKWNKRNKPQRKTKEKA